MNLETRGSLATPEQKITRIETIVAAAPEVAGFQSYEYFENNATEERAAFLASSEGNPHLQYKLLTREQVYDLARSMEEATVSLLPGEKNAKVKALFDAIEYRQAELFLTTMAADMHDEALPADQRAEAREWFRQANEAIYGLPERDTFAALAKREIIDAPLDGKPRAAALKQELLEMLGTIEVTDKELFEPSPELKARVNLLVRERFEDLVNHIDPEKTYDMAEIMAAVETALDKIGAVELGWRVVPKPGSMMIAVSAHQKLVEVGTERKELAGDDLQMKLIHEVGVHVLRSVTAEKAGWLSAAYGQDGYLDFEEALANILGESFNGKFKNQGTKYYIAAGLALGYDQPGEPEGRDFREVYERLWRYQALQSAKGNADLTDEKLADAKIDAFKTCVRIFRGTTAKDKGLIYTKDLSYFRGQEKAWSELKDVTSQADLDLLLAGKLDVTIPEQRAIAEEIVRELT